LRISPPLISVIVCADLTITIWSACLVSGGDFDDLHDATPSGTSNISNQAQTNLTELTSAA
jgi:hypothetical protein